MTFDDWLNKRALSLDGWTDQAACRAIYDLLRAETKPVHGVEIGCCGGRSLIAAAMALRDGPGGKIVGIDPYSIDAAIEFEQDAEKIEWWRTKATLDRSRLQCQREIATIAGVAQWCGLRVANAHEIAGEFADLTYFSLDGNHNEEAVKRDVDAYLPRCAPGCLIRIDDVDWPGVYGPTDAVRDCSDFVDGGAGKWEIWRKR